MTKAQRDIARKLRVLKYAEEIGNVSKACHYFLITREGFYRRYHLEECVVYCSEMG